MKKLLFVTTLILMIFNHAFAQKPVELKDAINILEVLSGVKEDKSSDPYKLIFSDEFNGNSLDTSVLNYETGYGPYNDGWGNDENQLYTNSEDNVKVENGNLIISARSSGTFGKRDGSITSDRINTMGKQSFRYGKIQAKMKIPYKLGLWAAFWMLGSNYPTDGWPKCGEIDIMESFARYLSANQNQGTLHWWNENVGIKTDSVAYNEFYYPYPNVCVFDSPLNEGFHIYEISVIIQS